MNAVNNSLIQASNISDQVQNLIISNQRFQQISVDILQAINSERLTLNTVISSGEEGLNTINTVISQIQDRLNHIEETLNLDEFAIALRTSNGLIQELINVGSQTSVQQKDQSEIFNNTKLQIQQFTTDFKTQILELLRDIKTGNDLTDKLSTKIDKHAEELRYINYGSQVSELNKLLKSLDNSIDKLINYLKMHNSEMDI
ncbi:hypothetical protein Syn7502_00537 [Synechococcus sp. PCC 7502]|uniref:hypothetical protein n=1 Tax=Synechococcus sp. PCC 7502 TaxID=1173263 RepID=UPI00029FD240|nr:hypothetical protein [Synechococcus sp. PCC 7502]AFY72694.1 hypothetical protein Syn7502_00537 [Synechococcus sp. PCC 7502]